MEANHIFEPSILTIMESNVFFQKINVSQAENTYGAIKYPYRAVCEFCFTTLSENLL